MSYEVDLPNETMERHEAAAGHHEKESGHGDGHRWVTLVVILLAMSAAIAGKISSKAEISYLTHDIAASDTWAQYQSKSDREFIANNLAKVVAAMPNAPDPAMQKVIAEFKASAAHMADDEEGGTGKKQLAEKAKREAELRNLAAERLEGFEFVVGAIAVAIGLGSASLVSRARGSRLLLGLVSAFSGFGAAIYGLYVFFA